MGDWDLKSQYTIDLETENRTLKIKNRRLKALNDDFFGFVSSDPKIGLKWASFLSDKHVETELSDLEKHLEQLEDLYLKIGEIQ